MVDVKGIIEQQLRLLEQRSSECLLTLDETSQLATLVKVQMLLKAKGNMDDDKSDPYPDLTADELKELLKVLK